MNIISKITLRYLKQNKVRTILTIIGIAISIVTISSLGSIVLSFVDNLKEDYISGEGAYDFRITNSNSKIDAKVNNIKNVKASYKLKKESIARIEHRDENLDLNYFMGLNILEASDAFYDEFTSKKFLIEGRMPRDNTEILIPYDMKYMDDGFNKVGNKISVGITKALEGEYSFSNPFSINYLRELNGENLLTESDYSQKISYIYEIRDNDYKENEKNNSIIKEFEENIKNFYISEGDLESLVNKFDETRTYTIVGYHYGYSEDITRNEEFIPIKSSISWSKREEYVKNTNNLIFSGDFYTVNNNISDNYNLYGVFSKYDNIKSDEYEITKILQEVEKENDFWLNTNLISFKNIFKSNIGLFLLSFSGVLGLVILISIVIFVYNIFTTTYVERLKDLGLLKVAGLTNKQLLKMILLDSFIYFIISVPLGYLFGMISMKLVFNYVNKALIELSVISPYTLTISVGYVIPLISAIFGFLIIFASNIMSALFVFRKTPIEAFKANNYVEDNYRPKNRRFLRRILGYDGFIASRNIDRNRKRFVMTILSITMSITMFTVVSNISIYVENDYYDVSKKKEDVYGSVVTLDKYFNQLKSDLNNLDGIKILSTQKINMLNLVQKSDLTKEIIESGYILPEVQVAIMKNLEFEEMFGSKDNIYFTSNNDDHKIGEKYEISLLPLYGKVDEYEDDIFSKVKEDTEIKLNVIKKEFTELESFGVYGYSNVLFMNEDNYMKLLENPEIKELESKSRILIERTDYDYKIGYELNSVLKKYPTTGIELKIAPIFKILKLFIYGFIILIMSISATNVMNVSYTNMYTRRHELALIKTVGIENKRLKRIVMYENMLSVVISVILSFILSVVITYLLYTLTLGDVSDLIYSEFVKIYVIPLKAWALGSIVSIALIYFFASISYNKMMKDDITNLLK